MQHKSKDFHSSPNPKIRGTRGCFSFYKFYPCIKAPKLPPPASKIKQQPDMKNIVKIVQFFFVNHALKVKIASVKDIYNIYEISENSYIQWYQILF